MPVIKYIFLGIIQGLTEFLPVSSSAHLVLFREILCLQEHQVLLEIALHLGTLLALIVFLFKDIKRLLNARMLLYILLATALTGMIVVAGKEFFESMFSSARTLALPLLITGTALLCTKKFTQGKRGMNNLGIKDASCLGIVQGLAVIPGLSRSGLTISTLLFRNVERETAFKFSFLVSIPAVLGALFFKIEGFSGLSCFELSNMLFGLAASFLSGLLALKVLLALIRRARLYLFGYYCLALGLALILWR